MTGGRRKEKHDVAEWPSYSEWTSAEKATAYLERADSTPHRAEGERVLLDIVPQDAAHILWTSVPVTVTFSQLPR